MNRTFVVFALLAAIGFAMPAPQDEPAPKPPAPKPVDAPAPKPSDAPAPKPQDAPAPQQEPKSEAKPKAEPKPIQEPEAVELFNKMIQTIYRPRAEGLKDIECRVRLTVKQPDGTSVEQGPFVLMWNGDKVRFVEEGTNKPVRTGIDVIYDLVGYDPGAEGQRCHILLKSKNQIILRIPEWADNRPFDHHLFTLDAQNRPLTDEIIKVDGTIMFSTLFSYEIEGKAPHVVMSRTRTAGTQETVAVYEYTTVKSFRLLERTITRQPNGVQTVLTYSDFKINTDLVIE